MSDNDLLSTIGDLSSPLLSCTGLSPCQYLPNKIAQAAGFLADRSVTKSTIEYCIQRGFRRSGLFIYRNACPNCQSCIPVRIPIARFKPNRTQRRIYSRVQPILSVQVMAPEFDEQHFDLYCRYLKNRHPNSGMTHQNDASQYRQFMLQSPLESLLFEFRDKQDNALKIVSIVDILTGGLSAVYTAYDPDQAKDSLGIFSILWQTELTRSLDKSFLYLGYCVPDCPRMAYKRNFSGIEALVEGLWQPWIDI